MPATAPSGNDVTVTELRALGEQMRVRRKALRLSATTVAQAASMSRVTLHRVERGEPAVTMGAYKNVAHALGLELGLVPVGSGSSPACDTEGWLPARVRLDDYPQLKRLAWQLAGVNELTPTEALGLYERNWRHVDENALQPKERHLIDALRLAFGEYRV